MGKIRNTVLALLACGAIISSPACYGQQPKNEILQQRSQNKLAEKSQESLDDSLKQSLSPLKQKGSLELRLIDYSTTPSTEFLLTTEIPEILKDYKGENKEELSQKYFIMWNYAAYTTNWVIESIRRVSEDSQRKIQDLGFKNYLQDNMIEKIASLNYSLELYVNRKVLDEKKVYDIAEQIQKAKKQLADKFHAPVIKKNPVDFTSRECVDARVKWLENAIANDLLLLSSKEEFLGYSDLIKNSYTQEQYKQYLTSVIAVNEDYLKAIRGSVKVPITKFLAAPFISSRIKKETENASEYILKLCVFLHNQVFQGDLTEEEFLKKD